MRMRNYIIITSIIGSTFMGSLQSNGTTFLIDFNDTGPMPLSSEGETWNTFSEPQSVTGIYGSGGEYYSEVRFFAGMDDSLLSQEERNLEGYENDSTTDFFTTDRVGAVFKIKNLGSISTYWDVTLISVSQDPTSESAIFSMNSYQNIYPTSHPDGDFNPYDEGWLSEENIIWKNVSVMDSDGGQLGFDVNANSSVSINAVILESVPEPNSIALLIIGGLGVFYARKQKGYGVRSTRCTSQPANTARSS